MGRLRGSNPTSTLLPDADNAAVGSYDTYHRFFTGGIQTGVSCFLFYNFIGGELVNRLRGRCDLRPLNLIWIMPT